VSGAVLPSFHRIPGEILAHKYRLMRHLGSGGMGEVYEAEHIVIGRRVAIKFLLPCHASNPAVLARFQHEAQVAGALESEHIAAGTDFGVTPDGVPYIVMERLLGETLADLFRLGPLPVDRAVALIVQACRGMAIAHARGLIHRDLKPANLFVCRRADGTDLLKILDFGIAKLRATNMTTTRDGALLGTPHYMSSEQVEGSGPVDELTDVYALAAVLYEALTLRKPHPGDSQEAVTYHILFAPVCLLTDLRPEIPEGLCSIVHRALSRNREQRMSSVVALGNELLKYIEPQPAPHPCSTGYASCTACSTHDAQGTDGTSGVRSNPFGTRGNRAGGIATAYTSTTSGADSHGCCGSRGACSVGDGLAAVSGIARGPPLPQGAVSGVVPAWAAADLCIDPASNARR
jgi:serine/threonine protein kinase